MDLSSLARIPRSIVFAVGVVLVVAVGVLDYQTGWDFSIYALYLAPIALVGWLVGRWSAFAIAALSGVSWSIADRMAGHEYATPIDRWWNVAMQLLVFATVAATVSALRDRLEAEKEAARTDELTRLPNRRAFVEAVAAEADRIRRYGGAVTVACLDLDGFKAVNDRDGHAAGDRLLARVATEMRSGLRSTDLVARVGGDEFYLLFPETWSPEADALLSRVWAGLQRFMREAGWTVTSSIGAATFEGAAESLTVEEMMKLTDRLMYAAKKSGGDRIEKRVVVAEPPKADWEAERRLVSTEPPSDVPIADAT
jgi:diguanylate cyclase (GGDEF)-like protein